MADEGKTGKITSSAEKPFKGNKVEKQKGLDTSGANCVITHRNGPKKAWYRDGHEIGVEDA
jgi:hypothetical protein